MRERVKCRYCNTEATVRYGKYRGRQYYFCKVCRRKFRSGEYLPHIKVTSDRVAAVLALYYQGYDVSDIRRFCLEQYGYLPSCSGIWRWLHKYTDLASGVLQKWVPEVGRIWIVTETMLEIKKKPVFIYDMLDKETRFLMVTECGPETAARDIREFIGRTGLVPEKVYLNILEKDSEAVVRGAFPPGTVISREPQFDGNNEFIDRFSMVLPGGEKAFRSFRYTGVLTRFIKGWAVYYNFIRLNAHIGGKTPAERCGLPYHFRSWADLLQRFPGTGIKQD